MSKAEELAALNERLVSEAERHGQPPDGTIYALAESAEELRRLASIEAEYIKLKSLEPFGFWHQGETDEESDFYPVSECGYVGEGCDQCIALYTMNIKDTP